MVAAAVAFGVVGYVCLFMRKYTTPHRTDSEQCVQPEQGPVLVQQQSQ